MGTCKVIMSSKADQGVGGTCIRHHRHLQVTAVLLAETHKHLQITAALLA